MTPKPTQNQQNSAVSTAKGPDTDTVQKGVQSTGLTSGDDGKTPAGPLFNPERALRGFEKAVAPPVLDTLNVSELLDLRAEIDLRLPARKLSDIDLEEELLMQFARTRAFYDAIIGDTNTPANQRAQVANSCSAILEQLIKLQLKLFSAERVKAIELTIIRVLKELPEATQLRFFELYERALEQAQEKAA